MEWDFYLFAKLGGIFVLIFVGGIAASKVLKIPRAQAFLVNTGTALAAFASSRLWFMIQNGGGWDEAGSVLYGWILGGTLALIILTRSFNIPTLRYFDALVPWMLIAQFMNRLGCYDAGCCFGKTLPGGFMIPVQLIEAFFDLALFFYIRSRPPEVGRRTFLYFTAYPIARFFFEFLRGDNGPALWFMTVPQVTSVVILTFVFFRKDKILVSAKHR